MARRYGRRVLPGWPLAREILAGREAVPSAAAGRPAPELLPPNERRRAPDTVAVALEAALAACRSADLAPASLACVFSSTHGDLAITDYMCATLASTPAQLSPTRFHNSVHNAAAGYWTIAAECTRPYTALSAGEHTFGAALLEASVQALSTAQNILLVTYDIDARGPLAAMAPSKGLLSAALVLGPQRGPHALAHFDLTLTSGQPDTQSGDDRKMPRSSPATPARPACLSWKRWRSAACVKSVAWRHRRSASLCKYKLTDTPHVTA